MFGLGDHSNPDIISQMEVKHTQRNAPITPMTELQLGAFSKGLDRKIFSEDPGRLKLNTSLGMEGFRKEHLLLLKINPK